MMTDLIWPNEDPVKISVEDFDDFLLWCAKNKANDIYLEAGECLGVKKDGIVLSVGSRPIRYDEVMEIMKSIVSPNVDSLLRSANDIDCNYSVVSEEDELHKISFRVNVTPTHPAAGENAGTEVVLRIIPGVPPSWQELGINSEILNLCKRSQGLVLLIGQTGSGKTTTIASLLRHIIETYPKHILTYEDPIEFDLKSIPNRRSRIVQSEIGKHVKDWSRAVRNALRRSPDVMLYGELRDKETIKAGLLASETGHLVFATVHANSVQTAFDRMVESMNADEARGTISKLIESTQGLIYQILVRKRGGGRVAMRSYLMFDDEIRRKLQLALMKDGSITLLMNELLGKHGQTIMGEARRNFKQGVIDISDYLVLINQYGNPNDAELIPGATGDLLSKGLLNQKQATEWLSTFHEFDKEVLSV